MGVIALIGWWAFLSQIVLGQPFGEEPVSDTTIWIVFVLQGVILPAIWWRLRLETTVTDEVIRVQFPPFRAKEIAIDDLVRADTTGYKALRDYAGYGYRRTMNGDVAFIVSGDRGVELSTDGEHTILIGSQHPVDLLAAIERAPTA